MFKFIYLIFFVNKLKHSKNILVLCFEYKFSFKSLNSNKQKRLNLRKVKKIKNKKRNVVKLFWEIQISLKMPAFIQYEAV